MVDTVNGVAKEGFICGITVVDPEFSLFLLDLMGKGEEVAVSISTSKVVNPK
jgi:hypothetical protein